MHTQMQRDTVGGVEYGTGRGEGDEPGRSILVTWVVLFNPLEVLIGQQFRLDAPVSTVAYSPLPYTRPSQMVGR